MNLDLSQKQTLKAAILADAAVAAALASGDHGTIAAYYNGNHATVYVWKSSLAADAIYDAMVWTEFMAATQGARDVLQFLIASGRVNPASANIRAAFAQALAGTTSLTNLTAAAKRPATRAEAVFAPAGTQASPATLASAVEGMLSPNDIALVLAS